MNLRFLKIAFLIILKSLRRNIKWALSFLLVVIFLSLLQIKFSLFYSSNILRIGLIGTYQEHDLPQEVTKLVSAGLVTASDDGKTKPNLITGWEVNNNATEFKFKLKDNLYWADGTKVKSYDLNFVIPDTEVSFPDDKTIHFKLKESYSPLPSLLIKPIFKRGTLIGTGPYKVEKVQKSRIFITKITLKPLDPKLPKIVLRFYPNEKVAVTGFNLGEVSAIFGLSKIDLVSNNPLIVKKSVTDFTKIVTVLFQTTDPILRSRSLRQAFAYQTPLIPDEQAANNPFPPNSWAFDSEAKKYLANPKEAKEALGRAQSQMSAELLKKEVILTSTPNLEDVGKNIVSAWRELGIDVKLRVESGIPQNFQSLLITQSIPQDPDQYFLWHATQTKTNITKYDSKRVDKDLEDGRKIINEEQRKEKYYDFQKTLLEDTPAIFLYFPKYNIIYLKKVEKGLNSILKFT